MKKTKRLNALQLFFLAIIGSLAIFAPVEAARILDDNFDSYSTGSSIAGQGGWDVTSNAQVVNDQSVSSPNSLFISNSTGRNAYHTIYPPVSSGEVNFNWRGNIDYYRNDVLKFYFYSGGVFQFGVEFVDTSDGRFYIRPHNLPSEYVFIANANQWYSIKVEYNETQYRISAGGNVGDWQNRYGGDGSIDQIFISSPNTYRPAMWIDDIGSGIPPHELAITYPEDEANLDNQLNHFSVEYFTPDCGDFHLQIAIGTDEQAVENATSSSSGIEYVDTLFALPEWCNATGGFDVGNYIILEENTNYYAKPMLYRYEGWAQRYNTKLAEGAVIGFAIGEYFGSATASAAATFYNNNLPAFFGEAEPSAIYNTLTKVFNAVFNPLLNFLSQITIYFSTATAIENGTNAGYPIAVFLAYAALINNFAGIPLVEIITTMLILQLAIVVINLTLKGKKTVA